MKGGGRLKRMRSRDNENWKAREENKCSSSSSLFTKKEVESAWENRKEIEDKRRRRRQGEGYYERVDRRRSEIQK